MKPWHNSSLEAPAPLKRQNRQCLVSPTSQARKREVRHPPLVKSLRKRRTKVGLQETSLGQRAQTITTWNWRLQKAKVKRLITTVINLRADERTFQSTIVAYHPLRSLSNLVHRHLQGTPISSQQGQTHLRASDSCSQSQTTT